MNPWSNFGGYVDDEDAYYDIKLADGFEVYHTKLVGDMFESDGYGNFDKTLVVKIRESGEQE